MVPPDHNGRLESWKAIARYLDRSVRTVRRWESAEGLPVHRHIHGAGATVYAYQSELDAWLAGKTQTANEPGTGSSAKWQKAAAFAAAMIVLLFGALLIIPGLSQRPSVKVEESGAELEAAPAAVLVASFENKTGRAELSGSLEYILESTLKKHGVAVAPRRRINDVLRLMDQPLDKAVDYSLGIELAVRDGGIGQVIGGSIHQSEDGLEVHTLLADPTDSSSFQTLPPVTLDPDSLMASLKAYSDQLAGRVSTTSATPKPLTPYEHQVTTESLEALRLFAAADALIPMQRRDEAAGLLQQAVALDPDFGAAHLWLAYVGPKTDRPVHAQRALELADQVTLRERLFIHATTAPDPDTAIDRYFELVNTFPDHYYGNMNLMEGLIAARREPEALPLAIRLADDRPHELNPQYRAAQLLYLHGHPEEGNRFVQRLRDFDDRLLNRRNGKRWAHALMFPAFHRWLQGDDEGAGAYVSDLLSEAKVRPDPALNALAENAGWFYLALGDLQAAEDALQAIADRTPPAKIPDNVMMDRAYGTSGEPTDPAQSLAMVYLARGDRQAYREALLRSGPLTFPHAQFLGWAQLQDWSEKLLAQLQQAPFDDASKRMAMTAIAGPVDLYGDNPDRALDLLGESLDLMMTLPGFSQAYANKLLAIEHKARAQRLLGRHDEALATLQLIRAFKPQMAYLSAKSPYLWRRCEDLETAINSEAQLASQDG